MSESDHAFDELAELTALLCDGQISAEEAARIERLVGDSDDASRFFLDYLQLHGELYWDRASAASRDPLTVMVDRFGSEMPVRPTANADRASQRARLILILSTLAASLILLVVGWRAIPLRQPSTQDPSVESVATFAARLTKMHRAEWIDDSPRFLDEQFIQGQELRLERGLAEVTFRSGARVLLEGPATLHVETTDQGSLLLGRLTVSVPSEAAGFRMRTPSAVLVDRGTEFGVEVQKDGLCVVQVFSGSVDVYQDLDKTLPPLQVVRQDQIVRIVPKANEKPSIVEWTSRIRPFLREIPNTETFGGSVADLRDRVLRHPRLIHHYTFEGTTRREKRHDNQSDLDLTEVIMNEGRARGRVDYAVCGLDRSTDAFRPLRAEIDGNANGTSLQSENRFHPPRAMTVQLLLNFSGLPHQSEGEIAAAVATRDTRNDCGFFVAVAGDGRLVHLMDNQADWVDSGYDLIPGDWYYVACTFQTASNSTTVNTFVAHLSGNEQSLKHVVIDHQAPGLPAASRLGIGKGFDESVAHAYPWSGILDEVAIYDGILDQSMLEAHLHALTGTPKK